MKRTTSPAHILSSEEEEQSTEQLLDEEKAFDYTTTEYTTEVLALRFGTQDIIIPTYQRQFIWNSDRDKQSAFIESLLLNIPIPLMFGYQREDGTIEIIDGAQRIQTLDEFFKDGFRLKGLQVLTLLNGKKYSELPGAVRRRFVSKSIRMVLLRGPENEDARFTIFERVNKTPVVLTPSEVRKGAYPGPFYTLIRECASDDELERLTPMSKSKEKRNEREELVLRFFAFGDKYREFDHDVAKFLDAYLKDMNEIAMEVPERIGEYRNRFRTVMGFIGRHLEGAFQRSGRHQTPRVRFEAIAVGSYLAMSENPSLEPDDLSWLDSPEFEVVTRTHAANSAARLRDRIYFVRDHLLS